MFLKKVFIFFIFITMVWPIGFSSAEDYVVGEGDVLKIKVYDNDDLTTIVRVTSNNTIIVPLLGEVNVENLSVSQIGEKLSGLFADGYLVNPQVNIFVEEFRSKKAIILGMVSRPGLYELRGQISLLELISQAGGLAENSGSTVTVKRKSSSPDKKEDIIKIDLIELVEKGNASLNIMIEDGDTINISEAPVYYVTGEVKDPGMYKYEEMKTITVIKAITRAGGFTGKAAKKGGKIIRKIDGKEVVLSKIKMDEPVLPDDIIVIPESFF